MHMYMHLSQYDFVCVCAREIVAVSVCICTWTHVCVCVRACMLGCVFSVTDAGHFFLQLFLVFGFVCVFVF